MKYFFQDLQDKVVYISGASSGIGRALAFAFSSLGSNVVIASLNFDEASNVANEVLATKLGEAFPVLLDVRVNASIEKSAREAIEHFGKIDVLINNAGILLRNDFLNYSELDWDNTLDTNLKGMFFLSQYIAKHMIDKKINGSIVNIASAAAFRVRKNSLGYGISKAGVAHLTKTLAVELAQNNIRVNAVSPGVFVTDINASFLTTPDGEKLKENILMKRVGEMQELIPSIILLASSASSYTTGSILHVDGGLICGEID